MRSLGAESVIVGVTVTHAKVLLWFVSRLLQVWQGSYVVDCNYKIPEICFDIIRWTPSGGILLSKTDDLQIDVEGIGVLALMLDHSACWIYGLGIFAIIRKAECNYLRA